MPRTKNPAMQPMTPEERVKYDARYRNLCTKTLITLNHFDFGSLQRIGVADQVTHLLERVGITREFLDLGLQHLAFVEATKTFLASLQYFPDPDDHDDFFTFEILGQAHLVTISQLSQWLELGPSETTYLGFGPQDPEYGDDTGSREDTWYQLTGIQLTDPQKGRIYDLIHPVIRVVCRILGNTVFARGESTIRPLYDEIRLISTMLRPDAQLRRPSIARLMVQHWLSIPRANKPGGTVACGSYVTLIAHRLGIDLSGDAPCQDSLTIDLPAYRRYKWLTYRQTRATIRDIVWRTASSGSFPLPGEYPLDFSDDRTWRLIYGEDDGEDEEDDDDEPAAEEPDAEMPEQEDVHQHPDPPVAQPPPVPQDQYALLQDMHRLQQHMQTQQTQLWEHQQAMMLQQTQMFEQQQTMWTHQQRMMDEQLRLGQRMDRLERGFVDFGIFEDPASLPAEFRSGQRRRRDPPSGPGSSSHH